MAQQKKAKTKVVFQRISAIIFSALVLLYFFVRVPHLLYLPIFNDEAFYMRFAQMIVDDGTQAMIPLTVGRQPLFIWVSALVMEVIHDPILPGRIVSLTTGCLTMIGLMLVAYALFKDKKTVYLMGVIYIFFPFAHVHDRLGILESMVGMFVVWSLLLSIILVRTLRIDIAYTLGFIFGGGLLTKANALFSIYMLPLCVLLFDYRKSFRDLIKFIALCGLAVGVAFIVQGITFFHPDNWRILAANGIFIYPLHEWIHLSIAMMVSILLSNLKFFGSVFYMYYTIPYIFLLLWSVVRFRKYTREKLMLLLYSIVPFTIFCIFARLQTPRYIYTMALTLLPLVAVSLADLIDLVKQNLHLPKEKMYFASILVCLIVFFYPAYDLYLLSYDFSHAPIPKPDISQYYSPQGFWVRELSSYLTHESDKKHITVYVDYYGWISQTTKLFLGKNPHITVYEDKNVKKGIPKYIRDNAKKNPTYLITIGERHAAYLIPHHFSSTLSGFHLYNLYKVLP